MTNGHALRCLASLALVFLPTAEPLLSAVITVDATCTLADAIEAANLDSSVGSCPAGSGADTIRLTLDVGLTSGPYAADGANALPSVTSEIVLEGGGHVIVRTADDVDFRLIHVASDGFLTLHEVSVVGGRSERGGGVYSRGRLRIFDSFLSANQAQLGGGLYHHPGARTWIRDSTCALNSAIGSESGAAAVGGAVLAHGGDDLDGDYLLIERSRLSGNLAESDSDAFGGAVSGRQLPVLIDSSTVWENTVRAPLSSNGGGLDGNVWVTNSTISGNTAESTGPGNSAGGGLSCVGTCKVEHTTFSGNSADGGSAIYAFGPTLLYSSLLANSTGRHCDGAVGDLGENMADDATCLPSIGSTLTGLDPTLADNGGPTRTHALDEGSPAVDLAADCDYTTDQRGAARVGSCDSGAYEWVSCFAEIENTTVSLTWFPFPFEPCHTVILGPDVLIEDTGRISINAGYLVTVMNGLQIEEGGGLGIFLSP